MTKWPCKITQRDVEVVGIVVVVVVFRVAIVKWPNGLEKFLLRGTGPVAKNSDIKRQ